MEKKRKLPARAAARVDHVSKKRTVTPPETRSITPARAPTPAPVEDTPPPPPLPKSIQAGKPLPTVESAQPEDLPSKEFQSVQESGVLAESLTRSRQKWISEDIFEKYWSKPSKKKGVITEDPNNPPKDSMTKVGQVTITVEPHVFDATMFIVKDPKPPPTTARPTDKPILQYGPPNGVMPPPLTPTPTAASPVPHTAQAPAQAASPAQPQQQPQPQQPAPPAPPAQDPQRPPTAGGPAPTRPAASPRGMESVLSPTSAAPQPAQRPSIAPPPIPGPTAAQPAPPAALPPSTHAAPTTPLPAKPPAPGPAPGARPNGAPVPGAPGAKPMAGTDPIILTLAEKASEDPELRDLMKRVAQGDAAKHELERFQAIIDEITAESKRKGTPQGPSADRLLVDGRTVRYFADEVRAILDIVLASNPKQTSADLRPPAGSDPLVVLLVKAALDEAKTRDMVRRIAENRPQFSDATDLKAVLDRLKNRLLKERERQQTMSPASSTVPTPTSAKPNGLPNGQPPQTAAVAPAQPTQNQQQPPPQQALRSKGPPPAPKLDVSAVVFEFSGGTGDRYRFPKFSILEYVQVPSGQQVIASFLIVRKGSKAEYPMADPALDYYQPVTIRLYTQTGRHLENLERVVAPQEEVRRYMNDVMDKMTRAEYILLAMRLPRNGGDNGKEEGSSEEREKEKKEKEGKEVNGKPAIGEFQFVNSHPNAAPQGAGLWTAKAEAPSAKKVFGKISDADEQYQTFIASVSRREVEEEG